MKINEFERIVLTENIPGPGLKTGDIGTIVMAHANGNGYEVEFVTLDGETIAVETLSASQIRPIHKGEIAHVRQVQASLH